MKLWLAAAVAVTALTAPAAASAATLTADPAKPCYRDSETINLLGSDFTPSSSVTVTRDDENIGTLVTDLGGAFNGELTLGQRRGRETRTYTATDVADPTLTASTAITVSAVDVNVKPRSGAPGRILTISATGFTTGRTLWAHVIRGRSKRNLKIGALNGPCRRLRAQRRVLPRNAALGVYTVQFDTFRRYSPNRRVRVGFTIQVRPVAAGMSSAPSWTRIF